MLDGVKKIILKIPFLWTFLANIYWRIRNSFLKIDFWDFYWRYNFKEFESFFKDSKKFDILTNLNESEKIYWAIIKSIKHHNNLNKLFLPWENNNSKKLFSGIFPDTKIITAGLSKNVDYDWNFEHTPPKELNGFDAIISQAMIEHIIDPFKHISDLAGMLNSWWLLVVHTVLPWFHYHRYPVDCLRFYPDWFEEVAKRLWLKISKKYIHDFHIFYIYQK